MAEIDWKQIIDYYTSIKEIYIECEETDPSLKTNLQPLNEFRAALDHLMRISALEHLDASEFPDANPEKEADKLLSHLKRAFYDICDMLSINYRNKIIDILKPYDSTVISKAIPDYYSSIRPKIEKATNEIVRLRDEKGFSKIPAEERMSSYKNIISELRTYYEIILDASCSLNDLKQESDKNKTKNRFITIGIPIIGIAVGAIIAIIGWLV